MRSFVRPDEAHQVGGIVGRVGDFGVGQDLLGPRKRRGGEDFNREHVGHEANQPLHRLAKLREHRDRLAAAPRDDGGVNFRRDNGIGQRRVARRVPHLAMAALLGPSRLVARMRFEQAAGEMSQRGASGLLADESVERRHRQLANHRAEALDDRDFGQPSHHRLAHARAQQEFHLRNIRHLRRNGIGRNLKQRSPRSSNMLLLPGLDSRHAKSSPRRPVMPVSIKPAMTLNAFDNKRLASINVGKNFVSRKIQSRFMRHFFSVPSAVWCLRPLPNIR